MIEKERKQLELKEKKKQELVRQKRVDKAAPNGQEEYRGQGQGDRTRI